MFKVVAYKSAGLWLSQLNCRLQTSAYFFKLIPSNAIRRNTPKGMPLIGLGGSDQRIFDYYFLQE